MTVSSSSDKVLLERKPKTARGKRFLQDREPKTVENVKSAIFMKGTKTSSIVNDALADLYSLKKPAGVMFNKKNSLHPFEGGKTDSALEFFAQKNDASFIVFGSHSKKRPNNMVFTRMFDGHIFDMFELNIIKYQSVREIGGNTCAVGMKPAIIFNGELFEQNPNYKALQNVLLDFFRGQIIDSFNLTGLESVVSISAVEDKILLRVYRVHLKKSGTKIPRIELELMGPSIDWKVDRVRLPSPDLMKQALRKPKEIKPSKEKNVSTTVLGETMGRVHVGDQKLGQIQTRKLKGLKKRRVEKDSDE